MKKQERWMITVLFSVVVCTLATVCGCGREAGFRFESAEEPFAQGLADASEEPVMEEQTGMTGADDVTAGESSGSETIWVYVCGAVRVPGVYELPAGGRVYQALEAAGGVTEDAELRSLNQAAQLEDGEQVTVYTEQELEETGAGIFNGAEIPPEGTGSGKVDLNSAGAEELMTLPGIGKARARSIISYRETHGPFTTIEDVMNIDGIKEKAFNKIKDEIEV